MQLLFDTARIWTRDLLVPSPTLYHHAIPSPFKQLLCRHAFVRVWVPTSMSFQLSTKQTGLSKCASRDHWSVKWNKVVNRPRFMMISGNLKVGLYPCLAYSATPTRWEHFRNNCFAADLLPAIGLKGPYTLTSFLVPVAGASQLAPVNWRVCHATGTIRF